MKFIYSIVFLMILGQLAGQKPQDETSTSKSEYKAKMYDPSVNFYDVVKDAEAYFKDVDKAKKGSGWKPYQRWKNANEYKYYPDGNRSNVDPHFVEKQYAIFLKNNPSNKNLFNAGWKDLGPYSIDSVTGHYSAGLGRVEDFYVSPTNTNVIYLGSRSGGFWKTIDGGISWDGTTDFLVASGVNAIAVSPTNADSVLINVRNARNGTSHGIYRSTDGGDTWVGSSFDPNSIGFGGLGTNFQIYEIAYHPRVKDLIFIGTNQGIFKSDDNLQTWTRLLNSSDISEIAFHPTNDNIIYLYDNYFWNSNKNQVYISVNQGGSYALSGVVPNNNDNRSVELVTSPDCSSCLYFASSNGVWKSIDEGQTFVFLSNPSQTCGGFAVSDQDTSKMVYGYLDLDNSSDGGKTFVNRTRWSLGNTNGSGAGNAVSYQTSTNYIHADLRNAKSINGVFYAATDGFLSMSNDDGVTWQNVSEGIGIRENYKLGLSQSNHYRTISGSQDNGTSINTEKGWVEFYGADGMEGLIHPLNDNWMLGSIQYGGRRKTLNGGFSQSGATPSGSTDANWIAPLAYDPNHHMTVYDFRDTIYKSTDFASTYTQIGSPASFSGDIQKAAIAENNSNIIVISRGGAIDKSIDGGQTFSSISSGLPNYTIEDIAFDPNNDDVIIVVYGRYQNDNQKVFITTDGGNSWTNITYNLGSMPIRSVVIDHTNASNIYLGAEIGVFTKPMNANSWVLYNSNLPNTTTTELEINYGSNTLRAATWGRGLWEYHLVGRADYPAIVSTTISTPPTTDKPKITIDQFVTSKIHYVGNLSNVYVEWSADTAVFGNVIPMTNTIDSTWVSDQPLPQYPEGTKMYFKVFAVGTSNDTSETYKFMYEVKPFEHCTAIGSNNSGNLYLENVSLENLNNTTVNDAYTNYTSPIVMLYADSSYTINLSANTTWSSNDYGVWIDYNNDASFELNERVLFDPNAGGGSSAAFTVPSSIAVNDTVKMRVRLSYWSDPETCGVQFGEVEDYLVVLKDKTPVGLSDLNEASTINIYPNPSKGAFTIDFENRSASRIIRVYDEKGSIVINRKTNDSKVNFNLNVAAGNYYISIEEEKELTIFPIIIGD